MANDTVSQTYLFPVCKEILRKEVKPIHYKELTQLALGVMGIDENSVNMFREIEDVREQFAKKNGIRYIGNPFCMFYLDSWVTSQTLLNIEEPYQLAANIKNSLRACYEGILRSPYMLNKNNLSPENHAMKIARGLLTEHHVTGWFKANWPEFVLDPDNIGKWQMPCSHDFKLNLNGNTILVDVAGPNYNHIFQLVKGKRPTDIHICAGITDNDENIVIYGYIGGKQFTNGVPADETQSIQRMIFYLNVLKLGLDYQVFKDGN